MTNATRRTVLAAAALLSDRAAAAADPAEARFRRTVRFIVPVAPGGSVDALARLLARPIGDAIGQSVVVENHPGAGGNIAFEMAAQAPSDGHIYLVGWDSLAINPALYDRVPFDPLRDFAPVVQTVRAAQALVVRPDLPANTLAGFLALSRRRPLTLGSPGNGSIGHLGAEMLRARSGGAEWTHVPYRGGGPASTDLLAGHLDALFLTLAAVIEHVRAGRMRALAVSTAARAAALPEVPTVAEQIGADFDLMSWQGLLAPRGTEPAFVARMNAEANRALADPALAAKLAGQALEPVGGLLRADVARWPALVRSAGARPD
jgi:tripartite-type tricarboxylate transporter receptor subunit TctC